MFEARSSAVYTSHASRRQAPNSGPGYRTAGLTHRASYLLGTFRPGESEQPFIPSWRAPQRVTPPLRTLTGAPFAALIRDVLSLSLSTSAYKRHREKLHRPKPELRQCAVWKGAHREEDPDDAYPKARGSVLEELSFRNCSPHFSRNIRYLQPCYLQLENTASSSSPHPTPPSSIQTTPLTLESISHPMRHTTHPASQKNTRPPPFCHSKR
ncbi:hypothetical protein Taro_022329 [Colocasia esculenta]|uniref:Uncharacterized protein n=1 Tax=Colocasia esculenta TaxID=4460 RepID=A0A843UU58_COLES|nr:hypothetical protein [Colocasia esculenta]